MSDPAGELQGVKLYPTAKAGPEVLLELDSETELEALCQQKGWTCAVLPVIGLGWVKNDQITSTEREVIDNSYRSGMKVEWSFVNMSCKQASLKRFRSFVKCVGSHLSYLNLGNVSINHDPEVVPAILKHWVNLEHLILLTALDGPLRAKLLSLDISDSHFGGSTVEKITQTLSNPKRIPALQELRMVREGIEYQGYASLYHSLGVNKTLRYLEVMNPDGDEGDSEDGNASLVVAGRDKIEDDLQVELLPSSLPIRAKLAFLSVIRHETSSTGSSLSALDALMVPSVFKFAAEHVQRRIIWEKSLGVVFNDEYKVEASNKHHRRLSKMSSYGADLDAYGFVENGVSIGRYLRCPRTGWDFALHTRGPPPLFVDVDRFAPYRDTKIPLLLEAVARIQKRSLELNAFPTGKAEFWATIFPLHHKLSSLQLGVEKWMMEDEAFPHIVLSFHQMKITKQRLGMLFQFMTSAATGNVGHASCEALPAIGLKFTQCEDFETESMVLLLQFLDNLFAHSGRRFAIRSLNLNNNQMNVEQLTLLSELLEKNKRVYRIEDIGLNDIFFSRERDSNAADQITTLLRGIFTEQSNSTEPSDRPPSPPPPLLDLVLKRLSFDHSSLRLQHFVAICSALRYGCPVEELSLLSTLNRVSADDRQQCWRWLAFALFYPRSKRLKQSFHLKKIELSRIELRVADAKAIKHTLRDPAAELVFNGKRPESAAAGSTSGGPQLCLVSQCSLIYETPSTMSQCFATLDSERELEALVRDDNGWICVVFPGFGLGWVQANHVVSSDHGGSYASQIDNLYELTIHRLSSKKAPISTLIECVGRHLSFLSLKYNTIDIKNIQTHCVNLKQLDIEGCTFQGSSMDAFLAQAHKPFFQRLVSLNLNDTVFNDENAYKLADALSPRDQPEAPELQELRIISGTLSFEAYEGIHKMLVANKTLAVIELVNPLKLLHSAELLRHFQHWHQGQLLKIVGSPHSKIAFLSALTHESALGTGRSALDTNLVAMIFDFAGTPVRRRIMWRDSSDGDY